MPGRSAATHRYQPAVFFPTQIAGSARPRASCSLLRIGPYYRFAGRIVARCSPDDAVVVVHRAPHDAVVLQCSPDNAIVIDAIDGLDGPRSLAIGAAAQRSPHDVRRAPVVGPWVPGSAGLITDLS